MYFRKLYLPKAKGTEPTDYHWLLLGVEKVTITETTPGTYGGYSVITTAGQVYATMQTTTATPGLLSVMRWM